MFLLIFILSYVTLKRIHSTVNQETGSSFFEEKLYIYIHQLFGVNKISIKLADRLALTTKEAFATF